jgi:3-dehydroquinate dehydratase II
VVLRDAVAACGFPIVEVHISDIRTREPFRRHSYLQDVTAHQVVGRGVAGYEEAVRWVLERAQKG